MVLRAPRGADATTPEDFEEAAAPPLPAPVGAGLAGEPDIEKVRPAVPP
jgi:hypothetical protein